MCVFCLMTPRPPPSTLFPYTTLFRSVSGVESLFVGGRAGGDCSDDERAGRDSSSDDLLAVSGERRADRKSTRLNSSHANISYAVFCLKKKNNKKNIHTADG